MKNVYSLLLLVVIAVTGCSRTPTPNRTAVAHTPDWGLARQQVTLTAEDILLGPNVEERGARPSEGVTVGDTISVRHKGWNYNWKVKEPQGEKVVLEKLDATRIQ